MNEPNYDYTKYANRTHEEIEFRTQIKKQELDAAFAKFPPAIKKDRLEIAVLGCPDPRMISPYSVMFEKSFNKPCSIVIFDKVTDHLKGMPTVVQHDATNPLPSGPFDVVYSHDLLRFVSKDKQFSVLENSFNALASEGMAIHVLDDEEILSKEDRLSDGWYSVDLNNLKNKLKEKNIFFTEVAYNVAGGLESKFQTKVRAIRGVILILHKP